jgi:hypothetical protein
LQWLPYAQENGVEVRSLEERVYQAMDRAGGRRGLALRTRQTYGRWAVRFARWVGEARAMLKQERARDFLTMLVVEEKQSFSSQKQALNALVFSCLDRVTVLPEALVEKLKGHLEKVRRVHEADREAGHPGVAIAGALGKKNGLNAPITPLLPAEGIRSLTEARWGGWGVASRLAWGRRQRAARSPRR